MGCNRYFGNFWSARGMVRRSVEAAKPTFISKRYTWVSSKSLAQIQREVAADVGFLGGCMVLLSTSFSVQFNFSLNFYMEVNMAISMLNVFQSVWFEVASLWGFRPTAARG